MPQYDGSIRINTKLDTKDVPSQLMKIENSMKKTADRIASLRSKMESLKDVKIPTQEYTEIQKQIEATEKKINDLVARQEKFIATGGKDSSSTYQKMQYVLDELRNSLPYLQSELQDLVDTGKAFTLGSDTKEYSKLGQELQYAESNLAALNKRHDELIKKQGTVSQRFSKMKDSAKKAFDAVASGTKKSSGLLSAFGSRLKSLALSLLIFNWISKAFRAMISGMKDGFTNFMNYSDSFANSVQGMKNAMSTLGNQFAAAFAPIVQMVIPWLNSLINAITAAMAKLAQFIALLTGASTFTRAKAIQDSYNKSLGGTASAAKKAFGALAKFDDLDVLQKKEDDTAGGGIEGTLPKDMFEEVPVDMNLPSWLDEILARLNELKDIFAQGFWDGLGDFEYRFKTIKDGISSIKDSLMDIWTDPAVQSASQGWTDSVAYMLGSLVGSLASIGLTIAANLVGGIEKYLSQNKNRIKKFLVEWFDVRAEINYLLAELFQSITYIFEAFASEEGQQLTANLIGIFTDAFMELELIIDKFTRDILNLFIQPFVDNKEEFRTALEGFLGVLAEVTGTIKQGINDTFDKFNEVYDEHFKPFFDSVAEGLSELTAHFLDFWNGYVQPILDSWAEKFDVLWTEHIQPLIDGLLEMFGSFVELLTIFWEETLQPLIDWMIEVFGPTFANIWDNAYSSVNNAITFMADKINGIIKIVRGVIDILIGIAKSDWKKVWDGFAEVVDGFKTIIKGIVNSVIGIVESLANSVVTAINTVIRALNSLHIDVPGWVTDLTGITDFGFNLSEIAKVNIPRLANGSVIRGGNPFVAILGDQPAGQTNIEAPLSTIEQGLENVLNRRGGYNENISNLSGLQAKLVLNINGMDVGEAVIDDLLAVMQRRGLDVQVLGASI